ncbi:hypothetical protein [Shigella phage ESh4]|nr:hypothetical protein [Shigella phage ESh4]
MFTNLNLFSKCHCYFAPHCGVFFCLSKCYYLH